MKLVEIRDLDGPNLFLLQPAIKLEFQTEDATDLSRAVAALGENSPAANLSRVLETATVWLHGAQTSMRAPETAIVARWLDTPGHVVIAFGWTHRRFALALAEQLARRICALERGALAECDSTSTLLERVDRDDRPLMIRDDERRIPVAGVTGTNGKTTTTRLLSHILMQTGRHVGWSSSSGVYIDGTEVLSGDYSGPAGARRVLTDPQVDVAVLETARGGILLRGIAYESNDVSVFTNVSADHLDLHGVRTLEGLAAVKSVVCKVTKPGGTAVLNAADRLVMTATRDIRARKLLFSSEPGSDVIARHVASGGQAIIGADEAIYLVDRGKKTLIARLADVPMTFNGRARHMVENAMAAAGAAIGLGLSISDISAGLSTFRNSPEQNLGRLNVFDVSGVTVVMDYAHNESGLERLLEFARELAAPNGNVTVVIGTAGDRTDQSLQAIGRIAAEQADRVIAKRTRKYLRGRSAEHLLDRYRQGIEEAGSRDMEVADDEIDALNRALACAGPGDVVAVMCQEQIDEIHALLSDIGTSRS